MVNEAAAKYINLKKPVGEIIKWNNRNFLVTGLIKDMVMESPKPLEPSFKRISNICKHLLPYGLPNFVVLSSAMIFL